MIIISKFHDYYDNILAHGIDKSIVYNRNQSELIFDCNPYKSWVNNCPKEIVDFSKEVRHNIPFYSTNELKAFPFFIGFCGKMYLGYKLVASQYINLNYDTKTEIAWSVQDIIDFLVKHKLDSTLEEFQETEHIKKSMRKTFVNISGEKWNKFSQHDIENIFTKYTNDTRFTNMFIQHKVPAFIVDLGDKYSYKFHYIFNPILKEYDFIRVIDPYTAFQEISMYIGGIIGVDSPETISISDKEKAIKHGMDKTSFRTPSPGKKFNRRSK